MLSKVKYWSISAKLVPLSILFYNACQNTKFLISNYIGATGLKIVQHIKFMLQYLVCTTQINQYL